MARDHSYIAYELRDGLLQDLVAVGLLVEGARQALQQEGELTPEVDELLGRAADALQKDLGALRSVIDRLRPAA